MQVFAKLKSLQRLRVVMVDHAAFILNVVACCVNLLEITTACVGYEKRHPGLVPAQRPESPDRPDMWPTSEYLMNVFGEALKCSSLALDTLEVRK